MKILVFGASGCGKTSLAKEIAKRTNSTHLDSDDYYWKKTEIPFQEKVPPQERNQNIRRDFEKTSNVIVSGSLVNWGAAWQTAFDLAVFITLEQTERIERLKKREIERYGNQLLTNTKISETSNAFLHWAHHYDNPCFNGTTLEVHTQWITSLNCNVLRLDGKTDFHSNVEKVLFEIKKCK